MKAVPRIRLHDVQFNDGALSTFIYIDLGIKDLVFHPKFPFFTIRFPQEDGGRDVIVKKNGFIASFVFTRDKPELIVRKGEETWTFTDARYTEMDVGDYKREYEKQKGKASSASFPTLREGHRRSTNTFDYLNV